MIARLYASLFALLLVTRIAEAGPIEWSYTGHVRTATGTGVMDLGVHRLGHDVTGKGDLEFDDYQFWAPLPEMSFSGTSSELPGAPTGRVRLFSVGYGMGVTQAADGPGDLPPMDPTFAFRFTLADLASGQHATIDYTGRVGLSTREQLGTGVLFSLTMDPAERHFVLGNNRYTVRAIGGQPDELDEPAGAWLEVTATANTPEPGTVALSGIGLAGVGLARLRRRRPPV